MTSRPGKDDGAILIIVLAIVTALLTALVAIPSVAYSSGHAASTQLARGRLVSALTNAMQAEIENLHTGASCGSDFRLPDADGPLDPDSGSTGITVTVTCVTGASDDTLTAVGDDPNACESLVATVAVPDTTVQIASWQLEPSCGGGS